MSTEKRNLNISGSGSYPGGVFDKVSIAGSGKITGDIQCEKFSSSGSSKIEGNIHCGTFIVNGSNKVEGSVDGQSIQINGACKITGNVTGGKLTICGSSKIEGAIKVNHLGVYGSAKIEQDIEAEEVEIMGAMNHEKFINAERVVISSKGSGGQMQFNEIGASSVVINQQGEEGFWQRVIGLFNSRTGYVYGKCIEADYVKIEGAQIEVIRGTNIEIGPNCEVDVVEYTDSITIHATSQVKEVRQVEK